MAKRLNKRERFIFVLCLISIFAYAVYQGGLFPFLGTLKDLDREIESLDARIVKETEFIRQARQREMEFVGIEQRYKQTRPDEQVMSLILSEIETVAGSLGLKIQELKPQKVRSDDQHKRFSVMVRMNEKFDAIMHFVSVLQNNPYLYRIEELSLDKGARRQSEELNARLLLGKIFIP